MPSSKPRYAQEGKDIFVVSEPVELPTGQELFDQMTPAEQDEQFGKRKADALRSGRISLQDLVGHSAMATEDDYLTEKPLNEADN